MTERTPRIAAAIVLGLALAGCGSGALGPASDQGQAHAQREAAMQVGDIVVRANALPTADLNDAVARQYGIERDDGSVMLLVGVRRDGDGGETALTARVTAVAIDLLGKRQELAMREVRSGEFIDYAGTARVIAPDTLRFDVEVVPEGGTAMELRFNRDFFPR